MKYFSRFVGACLSATLLAACGRSNSVSPSTPMSVAPLIATQRSAAAGSASLPATVRANLYVADLYANTVTVYTRSSNKVLRTISQGLNEPWALAFDHSGNLFVVNDLSNVTVYARDSTKLLRTISEGMSAPNALAVDRSGELYVANCGMRNPLCNHAGGGTVTVYAPGSNKVLRTISQGINTPHALALDTSDNLYVANVRHVTVYAPQSDKVLRIISQGINGPGRLVFDRTGNLYVLNGNDDVVTVYGPGSNRVLRKISQGLLFSDALAVDHSNYVYVANQGPLNGTSTVTVYAPGSNRVLRTISEGVYLPEALALDGSANLYVANYGCPSVINCQPVVPASVTVYASGSNRVLRTITHGVRSPYALAFGP